MADFGLARAKSVPTKTYSNEVVTLWYRPPDILLGSTEYSTSIDMWGVGCIFFEMATGRALFPGSNVKDEVQMIVKTLGIPSEETWPGISSNEEFLSYKFPDYTPEPLVNKAPRLDTDGLELLNRFLLYDARRRISAHDGMRHSYFSSLGPNVHKLPDTASIFTLPNIQLYKDPGHRTMSHSNSRSRRQSMVL
ncbi:unnamed protein product [Cyprideis torosa]|uniref:Uncharacterized protein n=1 Tax=Cyprideis torosa TaxID=163714 RepID=A0A7R8WSV8_9CRUS|nr:unnamed protein product [Cyprideis torosa]CAG0909279.1 unnamed protein product [Cyprideis torosa]